MLYILELKKTPGLFDQVGVVVANSIEEAAAKIEMKIKEAVYPPESAVPYAMLENDFSLTQMPEIASHADIQRQLEAPLELPASRLPPDEEDFYPSDLVS